MSRPSVLIPVALGTNRDADLARAFELAGAQAQTVPLEALRTGEVSMQDFQILAVPGGFSYGDALGAGRLLGLDLLGWFGDQLRQAVADHKPIFGVCNGFQALVRTGLLPGSVTPSVLTDNDSGRFECRWVTLEVPESRSVWTQGITGVLRCPVAHAEGRLVATDADALAASGQVTFRYADDDGTPTGDYPHNPNGTIDQVAGVCDETGLVLGLMPHPEDHVEARQDPRRGRPQPAGAGGCLPLFEAGVRAVTG